MSEPIENEQAQETLQLRNSGSYMIKKNLLRPRQEKEQENRQIFSLGFFSYLT